MKKNLKNAEVIGLFLVSPFQFKMSSATEK